ncbi:MAG: glycosyltransferase, partial [Acetobacteraceae bacterium]|nr:glycosyltransferase [Acetobacteraceae bacterium]
LSEAARARITETGQYEDAELPRLLARVGPHLVWFPAQWPETYSYTLDAAIAAGLPIVASGIGAFPERLAGRPLTWLADPAATAETWIGTFQEVRAALQVKLAKSKLRQLDPDFYDRSYVRPPARSVRVNRLVDLRHPDRLSNVLVPERLDTGCMSPCAYIRLLLPLDHPAIGGRTEVIVASPSEAMSYRPDIIATHRHAVPDTRAADALASHCESHGITLLYDLDDDLIDVPRDHPDARLLRARAGPVERMIRRASAISVSTPALQERLSPLRKDALVVPNGLDERLWMEPSPPRPAPAGPVRILFMGTATHDTDLALIGPALARVCAEFGDRVRVDVIGVTSRGQLPKGVDRVSVPSSANASYPAFVNWITRQKRWDIGLAPLADTAFNRAKSAIKVLDYAALGLPSLASDLAPYRGSIAEGNGGLLVPNSTDAWYAAISGLIRNPVLRLSLTEGAQAGYVRSHTLAAQAEQRRKLWQKLAASPSRKAVVPIASGARRTRLPSRNETFRAARVS